MEMEAACSRRDSFFRTLEQFFEKNLSLSKNHSDVTKALKVLYKEVQQFCVPEKATSYKEEEKRIIGRTVQSIIGIIKSDFPFETTLLAGTCLASFVYHTLGTESSVCFFIILLSNNFLYHSQMPSEDANFLLGREIAENVLPSYVIHVLLSGRSQQYLSSVDLEQEPQYAHLAILHGVLSIKKVDLLTSPVPLCQKEQPFFIAVFTLVHKLCLPPCEFYFHAFNLLLSWVRIAEAFLSTVHSLYRREAHMSPDHCVYFSYSSEIIAKVLHILEANWENPVNGVPEAVRGIYRYMLLANRTECCALKIEDPLLNSLLEKTMKLSWEVKGKYIVLHSILQHMGTEKFLKTYPDTASSIIMGMKANYVANIINEVYKVLVLKMKEESERFEETWKAWFLKPLIEAFTGNNELLLQNIKNYILPWTLKNVPCSFNALLEELKNRNAYSDLAEIVLFRKAKEAELLNESEVCNAARRLLHHNCETIRLEVFALMCTSVKKSEAVEQPTLDLIKEFISVNLNIDSSSFSHGMIAQLKILLIRIRDSTTHVYVTTQKQQGSMELVNMPQIEFVDWLASFALENSMPGACYQRRRMCLQIIALLYEIFVASPLERRKKDRPSTSVNDMICFLQDKGHWTFFGGSCLIKIFPCLFDFTDDIRLMSADLLQEFFPWSGYQSSFDEHRFSITGLLSRAFQLCSSCHTHHTDTGALIYRLVFVKCILEQCIKIDAAGCKLYASFHKDAKFGPAMDVILDMIKIAKKQLSNVKFNFLSGASNGSIHGMLLAIQYCISCDGFLHHAYQSLPEATCKLVDRLISLCDDVVTHMLSAMIGKAETDAPSFAEIGQALDDFAHSKEGSKHKSTKSCGTIQEHFDVSDDVLIDDVDVYSLTPEFQLLLSCCWHSIKNSCLLFSKIIRPILGCGIPCEKQVDFVQRIMKVLSCVLLKCRHRGVIEACAAALNHCSKVLLEKSHGLEEIPFHILKEGLQALSYATSVSVTRRTAGLALLVQSVVTAEQKGQKVKLLSYAVSELLSVIERPVPLPFDDKNDLPQSHAYHILKTLISDAGLTQHIIHWLGTIVPVCIRGFSSNLWPIRNGALQLFGVLLPRLCGQKKTRDDESEHNMISPTQLFTMCPDLHAFLLERMKIITSNHQRSHFSPELIPLLSLIIKLSPQENNEENVKFFKDLKHLLLPLLESPLSFVRDLSSTALSHVFCCEDSTVEIIGMLSETLCCNHLRNNKLNGILLTVQKMASNRKNCVNLESKKLMLDVLVNHLDIVAKRNGCCWMNKALYVDLVAVLANGCPQEIQVSFYKSFDFSSQKFDSYWRRQCILKTLHLLCQLDVQNHLETVMTMDCDVLETCLEFLQQKLDYDFSSDGHQNASFWMKTLVCMKENLMKCHRFILPRVLNFIVAVLTHLDQGNEIIDPDLASSLENHVFSIITAKCGLSSSAACLTVASFCLKTICKKSHSVNRDFWIMTFYNSSHARNPEVVRLCAAEFVKISGVEIFESLQESTSYSESASANLINMCEGVLNLLQDENEEIRRKTSYFASRLFPDSRVPVIQFNVCIWHVCSKMQEVLNSDERYLRHLWGKLINFPCTSRILQAYKLRKSSLFEQEYVNVYSEPIQLVYLYCDHLKASLSRLYKKEFSMWLELLQVFTMDVQQEIEDTASFLDEYVMDYTSTSFMEYLSQPAVHLALAKLNSQVMVIWSQKEWLAEHICLRDLESKNEEIRKLLPPVTEWQVSEIQSQSSFKLLNNVKNSE